MYSSSLELLCRNEKDYLIITLISDSSRIHLYYLKKQRILEAYHIDLDLVVKKYNYDAIAILDHLQYNEIIKIN